MVLFLPVKQKLYRPDIGAYSSYGIAGVLLRRGRWRRAAFVPDVSVSFGEAALLAWRCTAGQLDPKQLTDVAEDFVCK